MMRKLSPYESLIHLKSINLLQHILNFFALFIFCFDDFSQIILGCSREYNVFLIMLDEDGRRE
jgi:hypothetical protein